VVGVEDPALLKDHSSTLALYEVLLESFLVCFWKVTLVQQPCSNLSKSREILGNVSVPKCSYLQAFYKPWKSPAKFRAAFPRRR